MMIPNVTEIPLCPRPGYQSLVRSGAPVAEGRIVSMSEDRRMAHVFWQSTPGSYFFTPKPGMTDFAYVVRGEAVIRRPGHPDVLLTPKSFVCFPSEPFEFIIHKDFVKHSTLYDSAGLDVELEPLPSALSGISTKEH